MLHQTTLHNITTTTPLHYTTTTTALHHTTSSSCGEVTTATIATTPKNTAPTNHLSVHQWIRSAIRDSQQVTSPIGFLFLKIPPPRCAVLLILFMKIRWRGLGAIERIWEILGDVPIQCQKSAGPWVKKICGLSATITSHVLNWSVHTSVHMMNALPRL